jgi:DNA-binding transcriptional MerR regulator
MTARSFAWKVGELAKQTGVSVRTLHWYDEIGLLSPSHRTETGHRLYTAGDLQRLQQILSLRQLGFSLEEIHGFLKKPDASPRQVLELHVARLREQIDVQRRLHQRLEAALKLLEEFGEMTVEQLLETIKGIQMIEQYYTPEQLEELKQRREQVGEERMQQAPKDWEQLMADVQAEMDRGTDPTSEPMLALARRWQGLIDEFTGGNKGIEQSLNRLWKEQGDTLAQQHAMNYDPKMFEYMGKALAELKKSS